MKSKIVLTIVCLILIGIHAMPPAFTIDYVTVLLLIIGFLPWFDSIFSSLEINGLGGKVTFRDLKELKDNIDQNKIFPTDQQTQPQPEPEPQDHTQTGTAPAAEEPLSKAPPAPKSAVPVKPPQQQARFYQIAPFMSDEPRLQLASLRIELEKTLKDLAFQAGLISDPDSWISLNQVVDILRKNGLVTSEEDNSLKRLLGMLDASIHTDRNITAKMYFYAHDIAEKVITSLKQRIASSKQQNKKK